MYKKHARGFVPLRTGCLASPAHAGRRREARCWGQLGKILPPQLRTAKLFHRRAIVRSLFVQVQVAMPVHFRMVKISYIPFALLPLGAVVTSMATCSNSTPRWYVYIFAGNTYHVISQRLKDKKTRQQRSLQQYGQSARKTYIIVFLQRKAFSCGRFVRLGPLWQGRG